MTASTTAPTTPPATGNSDPLAKTRPLGDPLRVFTWFLVASGAVFALGFAWMTQHAIQETWPGIELGIGLACTLWAGAVLIAPGSKPNAIYLRAFRTDADTAPLRLKLAAILGPGYRLSGIRPPRKKSSALARFLFPGLVALRYAGSRYMDLEAGDDWMARLWRTYQQTRLVFLDVRELTEHVHREIRMTLETMGPERCVFLVGSGRSDAEWRALIAEVAGEAVDPARMLLLDASPARVKKRQIDSDLKNILQVLPAGVPAGTERGRAFVLANVAPEDLIKSRRITPGAVGAVAGGVAIAACMGVTMRYLSEDMRGVVLGLPAYVVLFLLIAAMCRAAARAVRLGRAGHAGAAARAWLALAAVLALLVYGPLSMVDGASQFASEYRIVQDRPSDRQLRGEVAAITALDVIYETEVSYHAADPKQGYACSVETIERGKATAGQAQLLRQELRTAEQAGYTFTFSYCTVYAFEAVAQPRAQADGMCTFRIDFEGNRRVEPSRGHCANWLW